MTQKFEWTFLKQKKTSCKIKSSKEKKLKILEMTMKMMINMPVETAMKASK